MPDFSTYTNWKGDAGVTGVVFGREGNVLEVEMNELQEIQKDALRRTVRNAIGDGVTDLSKVTYADGKVKVASGCAILVDGWVIECGGLELELSEGTAYVNAWEEDADHSATLKKGGNEQSAEEVDNYILDPRMGAETSRRKVLKYALATERREGASSLEVAKVAGGAMTTSCREASMLRLSIALAGLQSQLSTLSSSQEGLKEDLLKVRNRQDLYTYVSPPVSVTGNPAYFSTSHMDARFLYWCDEKGTDLTASKGLFTRGTLADQWGKGWTRENPLWAYMPFHMIGYLTYMASAGAQKAHITKDGAGHAVFKLGGMHLLGSSQIVYDADGKRWVLTSPGVDGMSTSDPEADKARPDNRSCFGIAIANVGGVQTVHYALSTHLGLSLSIAILYFPESSYDALVGGSLSLFGIWVEGNTNGVVGIYPAP